MYKQKLRCKVATLHSSKKARLIAFAAVGMYILSGLSDINAQQNVADSTDQKFQSLIDSKQYAAALDLATDLAAKSPNSIKAHQKLFTAYQCLGRTQELVAEAEAMRRLSGNADWAVYDSAIALQQAGMVAAALPYYDQYLKKHPNDFNAQLGRGQSFQALGKTREAIEIFEKLAQEKPKDPDIWMNLAAAYLDYHDDIAAENAANTALKLSPQKASAVRATRILANAQLNHLDFHGALQSSQKLLQLDPTQPDAYIFVTKQLMQYDQSPVTYAKLTERAVKQIPAKSREPFLTLGGIFSDKADSAARKKDYVTAHQWLRLSRRNYELAVKAIQTGTTNGKPIVPMNDQFDWYHARIGLANGAMKLKDFNYAIAQTDAVLAINPAYPDARKIKDQATKALQNDLARRFKYWVRGM